ncbi:F-box/kelch-repeat protein At3g06240 [Linum perenne]
MLRGGDNSGGHIPHELVIEILLRLSDGKSIARFRCVDKQWRRLLSDPNFIHRILWFNDDTTSPRVLIKTRNFDNPNMKFCYSLLDGGESSSAPLLQPIDRGPVLQYTDLPVFLGKAHLRPQFVYVFIGCCDGVFCISDQVNVNVKVDIILWNPSTSETKILPVSPQDLNRFQPSTCQLNQIGFGYDSKTRDYKVVRTSFIGMTNFIEMTNHGRYISTSVYSLKNDSWDEFKGFEEYNDKCRPPIIKNVHQYHNSRCERVHWYDEYSTRGIVSFDMVEQVFDGPYKYPKGSPGSGQRLTNMYMTRKEFMMSAITKGDQGVHVIWGLLDYRTSESWTKLFVLPNDVLPTFLGLGPQSTYLFVNCVGGPLKLKAFDPASEIIIDDVIAGNLPVIMNPRYHYYYFYQLETYCYFPSNVSISSMVSKTVPVIQPVISMGNNLITRVICRIGYFICLWPTS